MIDTHHIDRKRIEALLAELIATPSVNPAEQPIGEIHGEAAISQGIARRLDGYGADVDMVEVASGRWNVFGRLRGGGGPSLMLAAHTDTVGVEGYDDGLRPRVTDGRMFGRGAADMKGAIAAFIEVAAAVHENGLALPGDLVIAGLADEEHRMLGSIAAGRAGPFCDGIVVGEPTGLAVAPCHRGEIGMRITTHGVAAHSSKPELGVNAISHMAVIVGRLEAYPGLLASAAPHVLAGHGSYSAGVIHGGSIVSIVPDRCDLDIDRRTLPGETAQTVREEIESLLAGIDESIDYEITGPTWDNAALDTPHDARVVQRLMQSHRAVTGAEPALTAVPYCTDGPNLGRPAVIYGPGSIDVAHGLNEWVEIDEVATAAAVYLHMAQTFGEG